MGFGRCAYNATKVHMHSKLICLACRMGSGCSLAVLDMAVFRRVSPWISSELGTMRGLLLKSLTSCLPVPLETCADSVLAETTTV